eukprot:TRINITY_DN1530_c0_g1_i1.p1 TRINITY_DN1530_c0_g1~~TRINITY_DN1530_c0_g1_i1.p1  ORF type:complete len:672 (+),score=176.18 TRINITY_DN1530_c0_g1_i1:32-2017(+)
MAAAAEEAEGGYVDVVCPALERHALQETAMYAGETSMWDMWRHTVEEHGERDCMGVRKKEAGGKFGEYVWQSYAQTDDEIHKMAAAFVHLGIQPGEVVSLFALNCPEWIVTEFALFRQGMTMVPLYATLGQEGIVFILQQAAVTTVVCGQDFVTKLENFVGEVDLPYLKRIIVLGEPVQHKLKVETYTWKDLMNIGAEHPCDPYPSKPEDLCEIVYTSGTTGVPKGVMHSHRNLVSANEAVFSSIHFGEHGTRDYTHISYLPLAHVFESSFLLAMIRGGGRVGFFSGSIIRLFDDIEVLRPTLIVGVPRVFKKFYDKVMQTIRASGFISRTVFTYAVYAKAQSLATGVPTWVDWDAFIFNKIKAKFGGQCKLIVSGGAPMDSELLDWLRVCAGCRVFNGYGLTEGTGGIVIQPWVTKVVSDSIGFPVFHSTIRLIDTPEMGYLSTDNPPRGEILLKGPSIFIGYYKDEDQTRRTILPGGWLATGDIGRVNPDGSVSVIDRKKNLFKLSQGEYIAVEHVENVYSVKEVSQVWVWGDSTESFLVAVVVPEFDELLKSMKAAAKTGASALPETAAGHEAEICRLPLAEKVILDALAEAGKQRHLSGFEIVKAVHLEHEPWTTESDLLTPTLKLKRNVLGVKYKDTLLQLRERVRRELTSSPSFR